MRHEKPEKPEDGPCDCNYCKACEDIRLALTKDHIDCLLQGTPTWHLDMMLGSFETPLKLAMVHSETKREKYVDALVALMAEVHKMYVILLTSHLAPGNLTEQTEFAAKLISGITQKHHEAVEDHVKRFIRNQSRTSHNRER